ncbi:hypothetical protein D9M71_757330 [compost metagenome]
MVRPELLEEFAGSHRLHTSIDGIGSFLLCPERGPPPSHRIDVNAIVGTTKDLHLGRGSHVVPIDRRIVETGEQGELWRQLLHKDEHAFVLNKSSAHPRSHLSQVAAGD